MIAYHGGPITPTSVAVSVWSGRHAFVSFERPDQIALAAEVCQSFALDNGAFSHWRRGHGRVDMDGYEAFVRAWCQHPGFDWCLIPDVIDGDETDNDALLWDWAKRVPSSVSSVPVWHLHESLHRLTRLALHYPRVALGSSGDYATVGDWAWTGRMAEVMDAICDAQGRPLTRLHGLRMLNPSIIARYPFASADSTNVAQNHSRGSYGLKGAGLAQVIAHRIEQSQSAATWIPEEATQLSLETVA